MDGNKSVTAYFVSSPDYLTVSPPSLSFGNSAGDQTFSITSNVSWTISDDQSWITTSPTSGSGNETVTVSVTENTGAESRNGMVTVSGSGITRTVSITQSGTSPPPSVWNTSGSDIYYDGGNVGIGVSNPNSLLTVQGGTINLNSTSQYGGDYPTDNSNYNNVLAIGGVGAEKGLKIYKQNSGSSPTFIGGYNYVDAYVFEMTDANAVNPDGGIIFGKTGNDDVFNDIMTIRGNKRIGIGTTSPAYPLDVVGSINFTGQLLHDGTPVNIDGDGDSPWTGISGGISYTNGVAIGTSTLPGDYRLAVDGKVIATEIRIQSDISADYVFKDNYELKSLAEVETFIKANKHLPGVPGEDETCHGASLGEMNKILLQKIEELTLYVIEQNKKIVSLNDKNKEKDNQVKELLERVERLENGDKEKRCRE
jgi:hypothetical protein